MRTEEVLILLLLFAVTLGDHSGVPNVYVITMILAEGRGFNPYLIGGSAFVSILLYEHVLYGFGRLMRTHTLRENRLLQYLARSTEVVSRLLTSRPRLWLVFGRFVAFIGLYVPYGAGQMGRSYPSFAFWTLIGTVIQLVGFGVPAYFLGKPFEGIVQKIPLGWISVGLMIAFAALQALVRYRRARRKRLREALAPDPSATDEGARSPSREASGDELQDQEADEGREVETEAHCQRHQHLPQGSEKRFGQTGEQFLRPIDARMPAPAKRKPGQQYAGKDQKAVSLQDEPD